MKPGLQFSASTHSAQGPRPEQSDRLVLTGLAGGGVLAAVMDGVGSHKDGDVAAESARRVLLSCADSRDFTADPCSALKEAMAACLADMRGQLGATTCTALVLLGDGRAALAHIGDSALFRMRHGVLERLTEPHRQGRHMLTRALHGEPPAPYRASTEFEVRLLEPAVPRDVYLLATDGCYESVSQEVVRLCMSMDRGRAEYLVTASMGAGSKDNSSAVLVYVSGGAE